MLTQVLFCSTPDSDAIIVVARLHEEDLPLMA